MTGKGFIALCAILLVTLSSCTSGTSENNEIEERQRRNFVCWLGLTHLVPPVFQMALKHVRKYDTLPIGSLVLGELKNGTFSGLQTLHNDSDVRVYCDGGKVILNTTLNVNNATINYKWKQGLLIFDLLGSVWTTVENIRFSFEVTLNMEKGIKLGLTNTRVTKVEGLKFGFKGLGIFNPLVDLLGDLVLDLWKNQVANYVEKIIIKSLENELLHLNIMY
ncbi:hypothetical protein AVEN_64686-1 [Araneus ventricosus]|uniref:Circadian clock-controlled protein n=1 Tax=Araneus ventricosus TaxID=182803 RepID=A0A4Y2PE10_ARAVE|nr:hypothetical protein AVEN_270426-1 [Araneus ventricosus]GBN50195.1 hypothetical protein AVEN_140862-1 [Araneus ventricosus]GBN50453.1 hypothetical protein AVEN_64686-1 [Araneus ventricosus]